MIVRSELLKAGIVSSVVLSMLGGMVILWQQVNFETEIDAQVEKACFSKLAERIPLGHRAMLTSSYKEESPSLGIAIGRVQAQYAPNQWSPVSWTCRVNPSNKKVARVEFTPLDGGHRLKSAAGGF
ncbi:MAG: hypothetical protein ACR2QH_15045 [Geminicoccaceae bacterium]